MLLLTTIISSMHTSILGEKKNSEERGWKLEQELRVAFKDTSDLWPCDQNLENNLPSPLCLALDYQDHSRPPA